MDYLAIVRESWSLVRRNRALPALSLIQVAYSAALGLAVMAAFVPLTLSIALTAAEDVPGAAESLAFLGFLGQHSTAFIVLVVALMVCAAAIAVIDVAAQAGLVDQAMAAAYGTEASFSAGLSRGMSRWWRTAALLAIPALPGLLYLLAYLSVMYASVVVPVLEGADFDSARMSAVSGGMGMVSSIISLIVVPLSVLATLGLRFSVADDAPWLESLKRSWTLVKSRFVDVLLSYLLMAVLTFVAVLAVEFVLALVILALVAIVVLLVTSGSGVAATVVGVTGGLVVAIAIALMGGLLGAVVSSFWTVLWLRLTRQPQVEFPAAPPYPQGTAPPAADWREQ